MGVLSRQEFTTLAQVLPAHVGRPALQFEGQTLGYDELDAWSRAMAAMAWHDWRVRPGDRVAWLGSNHPGVLALLFGLARIGAALLPLNFRLAPAEWEAQVRRCTPVRIVHDEAWHEAAKALAGRQGIGATPIAATRAASPAPAPADLATPTAPALLVFTSGTTGGPKAAVHTQAQLLANMAIAAQVQGLCPDDRVLTVLPLFHVGGLCIQTLPALSAGARVILHARFTPDATLDSIAHDRPSLSLQVPATMQALIDHPRWAATDLSCLRALWAGSSLLPLPLVQAFHARGVPVCNVYGATETGPFSIALPPEHAISHAGSCGWPAPGVAVRLGEAHGDAGEVLVRGPNVVERYWPEQPACDAEGWFATGDLARQAVDGSYTIVGRARDLIISGGENIHPAEVEQALASHPAVAECAAFGLPDQRWGEVVAVAVVRRAGGAEDEAALREHLAARLARFKQPRRWFFVTALPKTALGKVQRARLAQEVSGVAG